jgi:hypothetical protein
VGVPIEEYGELNSPFECQLAGHTASVGLQDHLLGELATHRDRHRHRRLHQAGTQVLVDDLADQPPALAIPRTLCGIKLSALKEWRVVEGRLSCFDLDVEALNRAPVEVERHSAARTNDLNQSPTGHPPNRSPRLPASPIGRSQRIRR